ncbi:LytR C-terminal domain-containing protein [Arthrobacter caoxuetaonis]|uniref:LytR C-terminal domain-containing protein n=1 Tax=Arthrobacter caoxuetaonis TaxID=2886935 RepID=A0A9X1MHZ5_9MICC|nr:LytR C-terminal domain-containing protein [Arthrobacter caoxuetaonis]MCC3284125.1 LytR C-terminal domain-containing protein [Arthrobacter caoxuetaonis]MCC3299550.1 LytR C-terminal domain-containing protein [Arthrobacter caoxuetaonis]USQ57797.1 LytR C-terminal domain-containing protein [Arthrobacter caoxuetaonis]
MSQYPRDEFDKVPETSTRQGVHRERLIPARSSGIGLIITVGVLALLVGLAAYVVLPRLGIGADGNATPVAAETEATDSASPSAPATPSSPPSPSAVPSSSPEPTPVESTPAADKTQPVVVLNASGISGLGAGISARIGAEGWITSSVGNWAGAPLQGSVIFYNGEAQRANAEELSALLGIPTLSESPEFATVTVVAGPGFQ